MINQIDDESPESASDSQADTSAHFPFYLIAAFLALAFAGNASRAIPGGPFISVTCDLIPFVASLLCMRHGLLCVREKFAVAKVLGLMLIAIATLAAGRVMVSVVSFWLRPFARGDLVGL